ncbi:hypothetical protein [Burkholderia cepacia]|uniref:hypothetical protein n=1 Tax=Burkholderia cepacia TaxID=292 RepID=UPI00158CCD3E|nr:hypothetical protein [Burkholderia cepacia]
MSGNQFNHEVSDVGAPLEIPVGSGRRNNPLSLAVGLVCLVLIGVNLRPGIVSIGPLLPSISQAFGLSHTEASMLTSIHDVLIGLLALRRRGSPAVSGAIASSWRRCSYCSRRPWAGHSRVPSLRFSC